ncbi:MAG: DoxX family protein [Actinomycetota bacterium]
MIHIIVPAVLALLFVGTGAGKVLGLGYANRQRDLLHVQPRFWRITGILEWAGAAGLIIGIWVPWLGVLAAGCLALFMVAAAFARIRASRLADTTHGLALGVVTDLFLAVIAAVTAALIAMGR